MTSHRRDSTAYLSVACDAIKALARSINRQPDGAPKPSKRSARRHSLPWPRCASAPARRGRDALAKPLRGGRNIIPARRSTPLPRGLRRYCLVPALSCSHNGVEFRGLWGICGGLPCVSASHSGCLRLRLLDRSARRLRNTIHRRLQAISPTRRHRPRRVMRPEATAARRCRRQAPRRRRPPMAAMRSLLIRPTSSPKHIRRRVSLTPRLTAAFRHSRFRRGFARRPQSAAIRPVPM